MVADIWGAERFYPWNCCNTRGNDLMSEVEIQDEVLWMYRLRVLSIWVIQGVSKLMQPINMMMIYEWDKYNGGHLEHIL